MRAMRQYVNRVRNRSNLSPSNPSNVVELVFPEEYTSYVGGNGIREKFLLADSGAELERVLIFGR